MKLPLISLLRLFGTLALGFITTQLSALGAASDDTIVYWNGTGKRVHVEGCPRLTTDADELAKLQKMTLAEAEAKSLPACSRCPGSELNTQREAAKSGSAGAPTAPKAATDFPPDTKVQWDGGKRGHIQGCRRASTDPADFNKTLAEMRAADAQLCSRCPGSKLNVNLEAASNKKSSSKKMSRGEKARAARLKISPVEYDPNTKVYIDALWFRAHAEDCPELILKEHKKTMTLEDADKAGARIGESGQSGRTNCCFIGYRRKHPEKTISEDTIVSGNDSTRNYRHLAGCHRYWPASDHERRPLKEWLADGFKFCPHCIERGPSVVTVSEEEWQKLPSSEGFVAPEGWEPKPFSTDQLPSQAELEILIQETLSNSSGIQELQFTDPVATVENFMTMRFFFPVGQWLKLYKVYRSTGDPRIYDLLLESARHYQKLSEDYPSAAQLKASDPEGLAYMYTMAMCSRITLQKALKNPGSVSEEELQEVTEFLKTMVSVLKPTYEGNDNLDPDMGIPQPVADDFRSRAYNRALNGIGTIATLSAALEDFQVLRRTDALQPTIDRYHKTVREYVKNWFSESYFSEFDGKKHFYYPYNSGIIRQVNGEPIFKRPEDSGHYSHAMQGAMLVYESMPESGIDDEFMTAVANAMYHNATTKIKRDGKMVLSGYIESPIMSKARPYGDNKSKHGKFSPARDRFYMFQAFRDDLIDGLCDSMSEEEKVEVNSEYEKRLATLHAHYLAALRDDPSLIYLEEKSNPLASKR